jgi:hypothetical protein
MYIPTRDVPFAAGASFQPELTTLETTLSYGLQISAPPILKETKMLFVKAN